MSRLEVVKWWALSTHHVAGEVAETSRDMRIARRMNCHQAEEFEEETASGPRGTPQLASKDQDDDEDPDPTSARRREPAMSSIAQSSSIRFAGFVYLADRICRKGFVENRQFVDCPVEGRIENV